MKILSLDEAHDLMKSRTKGAKDKQKRHTASSKAMNYLPGMEPKEEGKKYGKGDFVWANIEGKDRKARVVVHGGRRVVLRMHKKYEGKLFKKYAVDQDLVKPRQLKKDLDTERSESV